jgi:hypothetical protein
MRAPRRRPLVPQDEHDHDRVPCYLPKRPEHLEGERVGKGEHSDGAVTAAADPPMDAQVVEQADVPADPLPTKRRQAGGISVQAVASAA